MSSAHHILHSRLSALSEQHKLTLQLTNRLSTLQFPPGSIQETGATVRQELASEIKELLKKQDEELEIVRQDLEEIAGSGRKDAEKQTEHSKLTVHVAKLEEDVRHARAGFSRAQLASKRAEAAARAKERELLFTSNAPAQPSRRLDTSKSQTAVLSASDSVTTALLRTRQLLSTEVERSHIAHDVLNQSTQELRTLTSQYTDLNSLLASSKSLLGTLVSSQKSDTWYLETSFWILVVTIGWLVFRRFLYGPLWWLAWLPLKLLWKTAFTVLGSIGLFGAAKTTALSQSSSLAPSGSFSAPTSIATMSSNESPHASIQPDPPAKSDAPEQAKKEAEQEAKVVRGDGTVLRERGPDEPKNPKKRQFEPKVEDAKQAEKDKDEL